MCFSLLLTIRNVAIVLSRWQKKATTTKRLLLVSTTIQFAMSVLQRLVYVYKVLISVRSRVMLTECSAQEMESKLLCILYELMSAGDLSELIRSCRIYEQIQWLLYTMLISINWYRRYCCDVQYHSILHTMIAHERCYERSDLTHERISKCWNTSIDTRCAQRQFVSARHHSWAHAYLILIIAILSISWWAERLVSILRERTVIYFFMKNPR